MWFLILSSSCHTLSPTVSWGHWYPGSLEISDADLKLNAKYKKEEIDELNLAGGDEASYEEH